MRNGVKNSRAGVDPFDVAGTPQMKSGRALLGRFKPYPDNPRTHPREEIELLAKVIALRGPDQPIVVDEGFVILKGHGRLAAAKLAKLKEFPYVQRFDLSDVEKNAIRIEDNALPLLSSWDMPKLRSEAAVLNSAGYEMKMLGFGEQMTSWLISSGELVVDTSGEWGGMPEFDQRDKTAFQSIVVHFKDQAAVDAFAKAIKQKVTPSTRSTWYPEVEIETYADKRYVTK